MKEQKPPRGLSAIPWRLPILLYKIKMGWLLGERFFLLTHIGRKSGLPRHAVLEVMRHDPEKKIWYASSGFGEKSQWFRNVMKTPRVTLQIGNRTVPAIAERLSLEDAAEELARYSKVHPTALRELSKIIGIPYDGTEESARNLAHQVPIMAFREISPEENGGKK